MHRYSILPVPLSFLGSGLLAQAIDILEKTPNFSPTVTFSDHYSEKVVSEDGSRSVEAKPEDIALKIVANLVGANAGTLDATTKVGVSAGYFSHDAMLGEALDLKLEKRTATFPFFKETTLANGNTRMTRVGEIVYSWTDTKLTIKLKCSDIEGAGLTDIAASDYTTLADTGTRERIKDFADVSVDFGTASGSRFVYIDGFAENDLKTFGSPNSDAYEEFEVVDVNIKGTADQDGPEVAATYTPVAGMPGVFDATGTATDLTDVTLDEVIVNGVKIAPPAGTTITYDAVNDIWKWKVPGLKLVKGSNRIILKFSDEDLNVTASTKTLSVR